MAQEIKTAIANYMNAHFYDAALYGDELIVYIAVETERADFGGWEIILHGDTAAEILADAEAQRDAVADEVAGLKMREPHQDGAVAYAIARLPEITQLAECIKGWAAAEEAAGALAVAA